MAYSSKKVDSSCRRITGFQSARVILLDVTPPFERLAGVSLSDALENVLCICGKLEGPPRIPLISIYLLTSHPTPLLPYTCTKNNFVHIHMALTEVRTFLQESLVDFQSKNENSCLKQGIIAACSEYRRYFEGLQQAPLNLNQLEVVVLTGHSGQHVQSQVEEALKEEKFTFIKRVVAATVRSSLILQIMSGNSPATEDTTGLVDVTLLDCDPYSLQCFFYDWFNETSNDSEHVQLILPPPTSADPDLVVKCDLIEQMLSPSQLPFYELFDLCSESVACKRVFPTASKAVSMTVPVHCLKAVCCIPISKLCDSTLFGMPLIVVPTACWKLDWEATEKNQSHFYCLCSELFKKDMALLVKLVHLSPGSQVKEWPSSRSTTNQAMKPTGYFVLLPSEHRRLLLKSVMSRELVLPFTASPAEDVLDEATELKVQASLSMIETVEYFNPMYYESGLCEALKHISLPKSAVDRALANRKKAVLLQNKPNSWVQAFISPTPKKP